VSELQHQARALGDPTRYAIFRHLATSDEPVGVADLASRFRLHHNAVRQHLAKLVEAGLVIESTRAASGRGRPRLQYELHPAADSRWGVVGPYERLSQWLSEVVRTGDGPVAVGRRVGLEAGQAVAVAGDPVAAMTEQMARHGFEPTADRYGDGAEITLHACPFASTADAAPEVVCRLHLGLAEGFADAIGGLVVDELVPTDPRRPRCRLRVHEAA
jgi:predicted ArsR family transcriptional regulator